MPDPIVIKQDEPAEVCASYIVLDMLEHINHACTRIDVALQVQVCIDLYQKWLKGS